MNDSISRRTLLALLPNLHLLAGPKHRSELSVEGYIFEQYASEQKRSLAEIIPAVIPMAQNAGYKNIELNPQFFAPAIREQTLELVRQRGLRMPSVYVGGALHEDTLATSTISNAISIAELCRPFGCSSVVTNPDPKPDHTPKTDAELDTQSKELDRMGRELSSRGFELRVHHHTPQLEQNAREWRDMLRTTDPRFVKLCIDVDWAYEGGFAPVPFLRAAGDRVHELHVRSARHKIWLEDVEDSDIDYPAVAKYLQEQKIFPLIVVELAHRPATVITRSLEQNLRISREYVQRVFAGLLA